MTNARASSRSALAPVDTYAPDIEALTALAHRALEQLPDGFRRHLRDVVLTVEEFADDDVLRELGIADPYELTGLYTGRPMGEKSSSDTAGLPDRIHLYRRPLLDEWVDTGVGLEALITHVVVHEVGHHFGLSDADMHALEEEVGDEADHER